MEIKSIEYYKPNIENTYGNLKKTYEDALQHRGGNVSIRTMPPCDQAMPLNLLKYNFEEESGIDRYVEDLIAVSLKEMEARREIDDNYYPTLTTKLGIADFSTFVTGEITFSEDTSWSTSSLKSIEDFRKLPPIGTAKWYKRYLLILEKLLDHIKGTGLAVNRGYFSPLDLAESLRGSQIYTDLYDEPEVMHEFLDYCADCITCFAKDVSRLIHDYADGNKYMTFYVDHIINMSEDIACMISADMYAEFCAPHTQKVIDSFGMGHLHFHSRAMYLLKEIAGLHNVANIWLATDPNQMRPIEHIDSMLPDANGVCMAIDCLTFDEIYENIEILKNGNFSICLPCTSIEQAVEYVNRFKGI